MSRSKKLEEDYEEVAVLCDDDLDLDGFLDSMAEQTVAQLRRRRRNRTRKRLEELEEARWLREQLNDWDNDRFQ